MAKGALSHGRRCPPTRCPARLHRHCRAPERARISPAILSHFPFSAARAGSAALPPLPPPGPPPRAGPSRPQRTCRVARASAACLPRRARNKGGGCSCSLGSPAPAAAQPPGPSPRPAARAHSPSGRGAGRGPRVGTRTAAGLSRRHPFRLSGFPCARPLGRERGGHVVGGGRVRPGAEGVGRRGEERG